MANKRCATARKRLRLQNANTRGRSGAGGTQDRGADTRPMQGAALTQQELLDLWRFDWAARKIVTIPVADALREEWSYTGLGDSADAIARAVDNLGLIDTLRRALILERLLGGAAILMGVQDSEDKPELPLLPVNVRQGDLRFINVIPRNRLYLADVVSDPFSANGSTTFGLPDLRGEFVRGWDDGRGVDPGRELGSEQEGQNALHSHEASTSAAGGHNHEASTAAAGGHGHQATVGEAGGHSHSGGTTVDGDHRHGLTMGLTNLDSGYFGGGASVYGTQYTNIAGAHSHSITTDATPDHSHTVSIALAPDHTHEVTVNAVPDHSHAVTVSSSGGYESRPRSVALLYVIKY